MATCLSASAPCEHFGRTLVPCDVCMESYIKNERRQREQAISTAKRLLEANGYTVVAGQGARD